MGPVVDRDQVSVGRSPAGPSADVVVIGGGVAGLAAARALYDARLRVVVLEARPRLGGRVYTRRVPGLALPVELGAEFVHGRVHETLDIADEAGILLGEMSHTWWSVAGGKLHAPGDDDWAVGKVMQRLDPDRRPDRPFAAFLESLRSDPTTSPSVVAAIPDALRYVQGFDAADPARVGERWLAVSEIAGRRDENDHMYRIPAGYDRVPAALAAHLPPDSIHLSTVVREIEWKPEHVSVSADTATVTARAAVVTIPLGVLTARADGTPGPIAFRPDLGGPVRTALSGIAMGAALRIVMQFQTAFWDTLPVGGGGEPPSDLSFLSIQDDEFAVWWTSFPLRASVLTAWMGGPRAEAMASLTSDQIADRALQALSRACGISRARLSAMLAGSWYHDWHNDPFSRGSYSYGVAGGIDAPRVLAQPIGETLFLAGEATDPDGRGGTVHAAIASGQRAAAAVLATLGQR
jgi:monoamine oxidase